MKNIILFGGAFDPIHSGHINMAEKASKQLQADVFFIPARISVWKKESAPIEDKIKMVELAINESELKSKFHISRYEADSKSDINYTINTVKYFKEQHPDSHLYLLIGTDQVNSFHKWKKAEEIVSLCTVIYFERPDIELDNKNIEKFKMMKISGGTVLASSTDIRELKSLDAPDSVIEYIISNNLYFINKIKSYMSESRFIHTLSVARLSYEIAKANRLNDAKKTIIAALLHDIGKEMPMDKQISIMKKHYPEYLELHPVIYHQFISEYLAKKDFNISDPVILDAIKYHTTANKDMSEVAIIVHCADKIEPTRGFDSQVLINSLKSSLIIGFKDVLRSNLEYYDRKGIDYRNKLQMACLEQYYK